MCVCARSSRSPDRRPVSAGSEMLRETGRWYYPVKRRAFRLLCRVPQLTIATITPFAVSPRYAEVAHVGVFDPQYSDMHDGATIRCPPNSPLANEVRQQAGGRSILCALGSLAGVKGLNFLAKTMEYHPKIADRTLVLCASRVSSDAVALATRLTAAGAILVNNLITDEELESLYGVADFIWACYAPEYDQASGVFGRAVQFGVTPILRKGSVLGSFASVYGIDHLAISYDDHRALALTISHGSACRPPSAKSRVARSMIVGSWRQEFKRVIAERLLGQEDFGSQVVMHSRS